MFDIGFGELLVCAIVALLVLGPERLPGAARTVGRWVGRARHTISQFTDQIDREMRTDDLRRRIEEEVKNAGFDGVSHQVRDALRAPLSLSPVSTEQTGEPDGSNAPPTSAAPTDAATDTPPADAAMSNREP